MSCRCCFWRLHYKRSTLSRKSSKDDMARLCSNIDEQLKEQPGNPHLWTLRGIALSKLKRADESLDSFEKALAISPKLLPALEGAAETAYSIRDKRAGDWLDRVIALQPDNATAHAMAAALAVESKIANRQPIISGSRKTQ